MTTGRATTLFVSSFAIAAVYVAACGGAQPAPERSVQVTVGAPSSSFALPSPPAGNARSKSAACHASASGSNDGGTSYTADAKSRYLAAKALMAAGCAAEARAAFLEVKRMFTYSRYARESDLQVVRIDLDSGDTERGRQGLRQWLHDYRADPRREEPLETLIDLDCKSGVPDSCQELHKLSAGFGTCATDADCSVVTEMPCCSCCTGMPKAMSNAWVAQSKTACHQSDCPDCILACPKFDPAGAYRAACVQNACVLKEK